jgi:EpsI family protein
MPADRRRILAAIGAFLILQTTAVRWAAGTEQVPPTPKAEAFPASIGEWSDYGRIPIEPAVANTLQADMLFQRGYKRRGTGDIVLLFVAWFSSQRNGDRQPHSPRVCLPGSGWTSESAGTEWLDTTDGRISATRFVVSKRDSRAVLWYWYQTPRRTIAGEWESKLWLPVDALRNHRTDTALVRIFAPLLRGTAVEADSSVREFGREAYPLLRGWLPRIEK